MKNWILLFLFMLLSYTQVFAQDEDEIYKNIIVPGAGVAEITIGTPSQKVFDILGQPIRKSTFQEEKETMLKRKLIPNTELVFFLGFDYVVEYSKSANKTYYPIYTVYFKDEKVVYMILSSYGYDENKCKKFGIASSLFFSNGKEQMQKSLGRSYISTNPGTGNFLYDYFAKGISLFLNKNEIRTMHIYAPLDKREQRKFLGAAGVR
jgi:outer membrane protein assembly factor BamE (lipoprotein component of BamABCDE complex)